MYSEKPLVSCEREGVNIHIIHVDGPDARRLGGIDDEFQMMAPAEFSDLAKRKKRSAHIARVRHDDGAGRGGEIARQLLRVECSVGAAFDAGKCHAAFGELGERPHDGVVLHRGDDDVVAGL